MKTGDASFIKQLNRKILLEEIIKNRSLSRSDLARITGLNKATVSAQVNNFLNEEIVMETDDTDSINRGRRPIILKINEQAGFSIGIDVDSKDITVLFMNLAGKAFHTFKMEAKLDSLKDLTRTLVESLTPLIEQYSKIYQPIGIVGICLGIHGIVNNKGEIIFTPKEEWSNITIKDHLEEAFHTPVYIDNNANFSVFAEQVFYEHIPDLFCITLYSGIGLGILNENKIYRGFEGFAGEIGHMVVESHGIQCSCGNKGCWELYASERALIEAIQNRHPSLGLVDALRIHSEQKLDVMDEYLDYLAVGLNNIINIFNPEKVILNGTLFQEDTPFIRELTERLTSKMNNFKEIRASKLGEYSCVLGGAAYAIKNFFQIDTIDYTKYGYNVSTKFENNL